MGIFGLDGFCEWMGSFNLENPRALLWEHECGLETFATNTVRPV